MVALYYRGHLKVRAASFPSALPVNRCTRGKLDGALVCRASTSRQAEGPNARCEAGTSLSLSSRWKAMDRTEPSGGDNDCRRIERSLLSAVVVIVEPARIMMRAEAA